MLAISGVLLKLDNRDTKYMLMFLNSFRYRTFHCSTRLVGDGTGILVESANTFGIVRVSPNCHSLTV